MKRVITGKLIEWKNKPNRKPLILKGVRQVGKTFILRNFGETEFKGVHYFNFEKDSNLHKIFLSDLDPQRIIQELGLVTGKKIDSLHDLIIFDEIQECPKALTSLKYFNEELTELAICCAGSLLGVHLGSSSFPVGKVDLLTLFPMNFQEFLLANGEEEIVSVIEKVHLTKTFPLVLHDKLWGLLKQYFIVGGMPEAVSLYQANKEDLSISFKKVREIQTAIYSGYLADMAKHSGNVNAMHLDRVFKSVPEQLSRTQDGSAPKFKFKGILPNISQYTRLANVFDWLDTAGLIHKIPITNQGLPPLKAYIKESAFKLFMFDIGMLGAIADLSPQTILNYDYGTYKGFFAENFILQELLAANKGPLYTWHEGTAEIEFLLELQGIVVPIEVKSGGTTHAKSLGVFAKKYQPPFTVKVTSNPLSVREDTLVQNYPLYLASQISFKNQPQN